MEKESKKVTCRTEESAEMLPAKTHLGVSFVHAPNIGAQLESYRANIKDVLGISDEDWPDGRAIQVEIEMTVLPSKIKTTVRKEDPTLADNRVLLREQGEQDE